MAGFFQVVGKTVVVQLKDEYATYLALSKSKAGKVFGVDEFTLLCESTRMDFSNPAFVFSTRRLLRTQVRDVHLDGTLTVTR